MFHRSHIASVVCALFLWSSATAQLANGSFEEYSGLPNTVGMWELAVGWTNAGSVSSHPDYYHLDGSLGGDLPETPVAQILPYEGRAIMGFIATGLPGNNKRSYISTALESELIPGEDYVVSFSLSNGDVTAASMSGLATSHIGVAFTTSAPVQNLNAPLLLSPQVVIPEVVYDREWERFAFSFTAGDAYSHMTIGVFKPDSEVNINVMEANAPSIAYYFIDDIRLSEKPDGIQEDAVAVRGGSPDDSEPIEDLVAEPEPEPFFVPNAFTPNGDGDNDVFVPVINGISNYSFSIFNRWGEQVFQTTDPGQGWDGRTIGDKDVGVGVYLWELNYTQMSETGEQQSFSRRGMVNLIR